ncbi:sucrose-6-phosphate hydrolase [Methylobacterium sp. 4-46]|uniref:glycoside hydrolase family 32 protein n=1 Tax=unclassified Methylobacterium TaxID=2615210 RepID=UPI000165C854|nr:MULTISPECIES: glycoside hydrolase family 32 protein [Methylobacterium]ACA17820.1 sucrose-6-phosphate hydrolase [Methylobacterium sp. 4-46]WFT77126.1 glycoside hydrolase family 32 protein [Methylobacterium nodulans]
MTKHAVDPWRPTFHIAPRTGLLNDPNGLVYWDGAYHLFYQWNPHGCSHANKNWAHLVSPDLVRWEELPVALAPVDVFDSHGCYSGSAVANGEELLLIYNGNVRSAGGERQTYQCLARSTDGIRFEKLGPVLSGPLPGYTAHFRDPKVWREGDAWLMVLGAQTAAGEGTVLLLRSPDLRCWSPVRELLRPSAFGHMCECPDFFRIGGEAFLILCAQHGPEQGGDVAGYVPGDLSGTADAAAFRRLDHGRDFYAPQTFEAPDGRRLMFAWMGLPEQGDAPSTAFGWMHCLTLPRELHVRDGRLCQVPARELAALRKAHLAIFDLDLSAAQDLTAARSDAFELALAWRARDGGSFAVDMRVRGVERTTLTVDCSGRRLRLDTVRADGVAVPLGAAPFPEGGTIEDLRIFVDRSSVEVFAGGGAVVLSARIFPSPGADGIGVRAEGAFTLDRLDRWTL